MYMIEFNIINTIFSRKFTGVTIRNEQKQND